MLQLWYQSSGWEYQSLLGMGYLCALCGVYTWVILTGISKSRARLDQPWDTFSNEGMDV